MARWNDLMDSLSQAVGSLPARAWLVLRRDQPEALLQFNVTGDGSRLRCDVAGNDPQGATGLAERGWELTDQWSGLWTRYLPWPATEDEVSEFVRAALVAMAAELGVSTPEGFTYLSWQEPTPAPAWQFWKSKDDRVLTWPELGVPQGSVKDVQ